jgi:hypothetical protein
VCTTDSFQSIFLVKSAFSVLASQTYHAFWQHVAFLPHGTFRKRNLSETNIPIGQVVAVETPVGACGTQVPSERSGIGERETPAQTP